MRLARALELTHNFVSTPNSLEGLDSLLDPSLVEQALEQALEQAGVATLRKRRFPPYSLATRAGPAGSRPPPRQWHWRLLVSPSVQIVLNTPHVAVLLHQRGPHIGARRVGDATGNGSTIESARLGYNFLRSTHRQYIATG